MAIVCSDILTDDFASIGNNCNSIPIIVDNLESIANILCEMQCAVGHIATTDDCSILPEDFIDLFPACDEIPSNGVVLQACSCAQGGLKIWVWDGSDWVRIAKEFAVGALSDFVDPNAPTPAELLALFGGHIANDAMVIVRPTSEIWFTANCGTTWTLLFDIPPIGADAENIVWDQTYFQSAPDANFFQWFDEELYTNGDTTTFPVEVGDLVDMTVVYGYVIDQYANATNPVDNINFRFRISGVIAQTDFLYGDPNGVAAIRNGVNYAEFNYKFRATVAGDLRLRIYSTATGTLPVDATDWQWTFYVSRSSVSVTRAEFSV